MDRHRQYSLVIARVLISIVFLMNGLGIVDQSAAAQLLAEEGVPAAIVPVMMFGARTLEVVGGVALALSIFPRWAALALLVFLVPTTFVGHSFWSAAGTPLFTVQLINFLKNVAMCGGLLFVAGVSNQPRVFPRAEATPGRAQRVHARLTKWRKEGQI